MQRNRVFVIILDIGFYLVLAFATIYCLTETIINTNLTNALDFGIICKSFASILVIVSLCIIRAELKKIKVVKISTRDWLMTIYAACFVLVILTNVIF